MSDFSISSGGVFPCCLKEITPANSINIINLLYLLRRYRRGIWLWFNIYVRIQCSPSVKDRQKRWPSKGTSQMRSSPSTQSQNWMLLSAPYIALVIMPDILPPEDRWKDICFLSDSALHWALGCCSLRPVFSNYFYFRRHEGKKKDLFNPSFQKILHRQCGSCRDGWWDTRNHSFIFRLYCQQVRRYFKEFL